MQNPLIAPLLLTVLGLAAGCAGSEFSGSGGKASSSDAKKAAKDGDKDPGKDGDKTKAGDKNGKDDKSKDKSKGKDGKKGKDGTSGGPGENGDKADGKDGSGGDKDDGSVDVDAATNDTVINEDGKTVRCLRRPVDVKIMFIMDITGSMAPSIELVKANVAQFASQVASIDFGTKDVKVASVSVGGIAFKDVAAEQGLIPLGAPASLASQVGGLQAMGGGDGTEGGMLALRTGLEQLKLSGAAPDHDLVPVTILITDNFGHDGEGGGGEMTGGFPGGSPFDPFGGGGLPPSARNCSPDWAPLQALFNDPAMDLLLMYDASPNGTGAPAPGLGGKFGGFGGFGAQPCPPYLDAGQQPAKQWEDVRQRWQASHKDSVVPGRGFGFPFTAEALVTALPEDLKRSFKACE